MTLAVTPPPTTRRVTDSPARGRATAQGLGEALGPVSRVVLVYALVVQTLPLLPSMPTGDLDGSWRLAVNRAVVDGFVFGEDVVFTFGPLAGVLTGVHEPGLRLLVLVAAAVVTVGLVVAALRVVRGAPTWLVVCLAAAVLAWGGWDAAPDAVPLLGPLVLAAGLLAPGGRVLASGGRWQQAAMVAPFGVLPLVKFSLVPAAAVSWLAVLGWTAWRRDGRGVLVVVVVPTLTCLLFWWWAGQPVSAGALAHYVEGSWDVAAGYSAAMSSPGSTRWGTGSVTAVYGVAALLVLGLWARAARDRSEAGVLLVVCAATLFVTFKAGFVRADVLHVRMGALVLVGAALLAVATSRATPARTAVVVAVAGLAAVVFHATAPWPTALGGLVRAAEVPAAAVTGRLGSADLDARYDEALASVRQLQPLPPTYGTVDLYPHALAGLLAHEREWSPRPVIQSYSSYTPGLARRNALALAGPRAPRALLVGVDPIDGRLAALEDGASWLTMLSRYSVERADDDLLALQRRPRSLPVRPGPATEVEVPLGEVVALPATGEVVLASFRVEPTGIGRLRDVLWRQPELWIEVTLDDGTTHRRRFVPGGAVAPFVLSPFVDDTGDLRRLFSSLSDGTVASGRRATAIRLEAPGGEHFWRASYLLRLRPVGLSDRDPVPSSSPGS